jgi:hypothetical protein
MLVDCTYGCLNHLRARRPTGAAVPRSQVRAQWLLHEKNRRQILYRDFIEETSKSYIHAAKHAEPDIPGLVGLYAKPSRMRTQS